MADTAITGRNSCMVHSTGACKVHIYMSVCFSAISDHCCEVLPYMAHSTVVCLPYDPLRCLPLNAVESIPHSTVLMSSVGSTQPICIVYFMVHHLYTAVYCTLDSTVEWIPQLHVPGLLIVLVMNFSLCPIFCHRVHYIAAYLL